MNSSAARLEAQHGGKVTYHGFVHTFEMLVPPDTYFDEHPEYFSLVNGRRIKERSQLCCTNEALIALVTEEVRRRMAAHPEIIERPMVVKGAKARLGRPPEQVLEIL